MVIKFKKFNLNLEDKFFLLILILSFLEVPLRFSGLSLYRMMLPITILICLKYFLQIKRYLIYLTIFFLYNMIVIFINDSSLVHSINTFLFLIPIFMIFCILKIISFRIQDYKSLIIDLLIKFAWLIVCLTIIQSILGFHLPNTLNRAGSYNAFFWTENECGTALIGVFPLLIYNRGIYKKKSDLILIVLILYVLYINDCKTSLICSVVIICMWILLRKINRFSNKKVIFGGSILFLILSILFLFVLNPTLKFSEYNISLEKLIFDPVIHILQLNPFRSAGSIFDRTDAVIYGLISLKNSYFLGVGFGNATLIFTNSLYHLRTAESMHNLFMQLIVEEGFLFIGFYILLGFKLIKILIKKSYVDYIDIFKFIYWISFPLMSMQSSQGILSVYYFWCCIGLIITMQSTNCIKYRKKTIKGCNLFQENYYKRSV